MDGKLHYYFCNRVRRDKAIAPGEVKGHFVRHPRVAQPHVPQQKPLIDRDVTCIYIYIYINIYHRCRVIL